MIAVLEFVFSGFWHFVGTCMLIGVLCSGVAGIIRSFRGEP